MSSPKRSGTSDADDRAGADEASKDAATAVTVDGADAAESGYRRDDYWRQQQQGLPPDAGADPKGDTDDDAS